MANATYPVLQPMRIQVRQNSPAEKQYYAQSALPKAWPMPKAIAPGISPAPLEDLIFHGGRVLPQIEFQNVYLGDATSWKASDIDSIDRAIDLAMRDRSLNNVMVQYFPGAAISCEMRESFILNEAKPQQLDEADVQAIVKALYVDGRISRNDLPTTIFNLLLPAGSVLKLGNSSSTNGLGGYHGSLHFNDPADDKKRTLYYSANVYSEIRPDHSENGIAVFNRPWKNVVATLYHEINEFRTDADVNDAIAHGTNDFLGWTSRSGREVGDQPIFAASSLDLVFQEVQVATSSKRIPVQFMYSNAVHGAEGPIAEPHALSFS
ncbi:hypothetical protein [Candidatus Accumulibacter sp. ACC003]|jgi:hypothetical protein|uniref:hypothetical protein n=1 Tax=Candidatus Accumulibacter sp. ACC003 TaxID=2823334 RepID=UPI0025B7CE91|nr:hypothetical protein [Candidatus Accumulibacter sp. ACC003]